jgi:hypothetical protein
VHKLQVASASEAWFTKVLACYNAPVSRLLPWFGLLLLACGGAASSSIVSPAASSHHDLLQRSTEGPAAVLGQLRHLRRVIEQIDMHAPAVETQGYDHVKEAEWPFFLALFYAHTTCQLAVA